MHRQKGRTRRKGIYHLLRNQETYAVEIFGELRGNVESTGVNAESVLLPNLVSSRLARVASDYGNRPRSIKIYNLNGRIVLWTM